jgi:hypothetical protein
LGEINKNDGGGEFNYDILIVRTFVNVRMYPQENNIIIIIIIIIIKIMVSVKNRKSKMVAHS